MLDSFATRDTLKVNGSSYQIASLTKLGQRFDLKTPALFAEDPAGKPVAP